MSLLPFVNNNVKDNESQEQNLIKFDSNAIQLASGTEANSNGVKCNGLPYIPESPALSLDPVLTLQIGSQHAADSAANKTTTNDWKLPNPGLAASCKYFSSNVIGY